MGAQGSMANGDAQRQPVAQGGWKTAGAQPLPPVRQVQPSVSPVPTPVATDDVTSRVRFGKRMARPTLGQALSVGQASDMSVTGSQQTDQMSPTSAQTMQQATPPPVGLRGASDAERANREYYKWAAAQSIVDAQRKAGQNAFDIMGHQDPRQGLFDPSIWSRMSPEAQTEARRGAYANYLPGGNAAGQVVSGDQLDFGANWQRNAVTYERDPQTGQVWMVIRDGNQVKRHPVQG